MTSGGVVCVTSSTPATNPHAVMAFSGHRNPSMFRRYHIINLDDLRQAAVRGSQYAGTPEHLVPFRAKAVESSDRTRTVGVRG